jgi:adenosylcobinamide-phosphate synthase
VTALLAGYAADLAFGDPRRGHPVAAFGRIALAFERAIYAPSRLRGALFTGTLVAGTALLAELAARRHRGTVLATATWAALGGRSLCRTALTIGAELDRGRLEAARATLPALVGRDPATLDAAGVSRAVVESVAENTCDAVVATLLWGAVAGPAGVAAHRTVNTLDAMVGHRNDRYAEFGWAAARLDDALGWPPARVGAALTALIGGRAAWRVLRRDGAAHPSPNAGRMEAAFAGALGLQLGGPLTYEGRHEDRPRMGDGRPAEPRDIRRAVRLARMVAALAALMCAGARAARGRAAARRPAARNHATRVWRPA